MMAAMVDRTKPYPVIDEDNRAFWEGAQRHELIIKRCGDCGFYIHYPKPFCPKCWSENVQPTQVSGRGRVFSFNIVRQQLAPGIPPPYVVALVSLEEQESVRLICNIVECPPEAVSIGMPVEVTFQDGDEELTIPQFKPAPPAQAERAT